MPQLLAHLFGDYILQSDWMAQNKTKRSWPALVHALLYSLCFVPLCWHPDTYHGYESIRVMLNGIWTSVDAWNFSTTWASRFHPWAWLVIFGTHFLIDRFRLARYVVWAKNFMGPKKFWYRSIAGGVPHWTDDVEYIKTMKGDGFKADDYYIFYGAMPPLWACPTGYPPTTPIWLSTWLLIIADNTLHLAINYAALRWL